MIQFLTTEEFCPGCNNPLIFHDGSKVFCADCECTGSLSDDGSISWGDICDSWGDICDSCWDEQETLLQEVVRNVKNMLRRWGIHYRITE